MDLYEDLGDLCIWVRGHLLLQIELVLLTYFRVAYFDYYFI